MYAVITGDIVDSTSRARGKDSHIFSDIDHNLTLVFEHMIGKGWLAAGDFVSFRGDSFQCLLPVEWGMEAALLIKAALMGGIASEPGTSSPLSWSCRLVVGLGEVTYRAEQISKSNGPAFLLSGRTLDAMPKDQFTNVMSGWDDANGEFDLMCRYLDIIIERVWTVNSAWTAWMFFKDEYTQREMADFFGISQSAMNQRIQGAEIAVLEQTIRRYRSIIKNYHS